MYKKLFLIIFCCSILGYAQGTKPNCAIMGYTDTFVYTYYDANKTITITSGPKMCDFLNKEPQKNASSYYVVQNELRSGAEGKTVTPARKFCGKNTDHLLPCCFRDGQGKVHTCG